MGLPTVPGARQCSARREPCPHYHLEVPEPWRCYLLGPLCHPSAPPCPGSWSPWICVPSLCWAFPLSLHPLPKGPSRPSLAQPLSLCSALWLQAQPGGATSAS